MLGLAYYFMVLAPMEILSFSVGQDIFMDAWAACGLFAFLSGLLFISGLWRVPWPAVKMIWPFILFVVLGFYSCLTSPYAIAAFARGLRESVGIAGAIMLAISFAALVSASLATLQRLVRCASIVGGVLGGVALVQFVVNNLGFGPVFNFHAIWALTNGNGSQDQLELTAGLWRPASLDGEAAHLGTFLGACSGFALARLGLLGRRAAACLAPCVPRWAAFCVVGAFAVSLSLVAYMVLAISLLTTLALGMAVQARERHGWVRPRLIGAVVIVMIAVPVVAAGELTQKLASLSIVSEALGGGDIEAGNAATYDGVILATSALITARNLADRPVLGVGLGAYPFAFDAVAPDFVLKSDYFSHINRNGESSLLLRLLSETGMLGTSCFLLGCFSILRCGWITARSTKRLAAEDARAATLHYIAIASTGSCAAVLFGYLGRYGAYYDGTLWEALAFNLSLVTLHASGFSRTNVLQPARPPPPEGLVAPNVYTI